MACTSDFVASTEPTPAPVTRRADPVAAPLIGVVAARASEIVAARVDGRIVRVITKSGQRVHAGDPIAELDPTLLAERLRAATSAVAARDVQIGTLGDVRVVAAR